MKEYRPRIVDRLLKRKLSHAGGVLIQGPKWCGKTTTAAQQAASAVYMADPANESLALVDYSAVLDGPTPRLVDEWQVMPRLWDAARFQIDQRGKTGQFIFTGSAVPADTSKIFHSGAGRFSWLTMRTMSLYESGDSNGAVSLASLFAGQKLPGAQCDINIRQLARLMCRGGWPAIVASPDQEMALERARDYVRAVVTSDVNRADGVTRNPQRTMRILASLARHQGDQVSINGIREDIIQNDSDTISTDTISSYINALADIFVIEDSRAWNPKLRSKTAIRSSDTRYFSDPSIALAVMGMGENDILADPNTMGLAFETMAVRDLRVYASALGGEVFHFRDKTGLECDSVIHLENGKYGLVEVKLGGETLIEHGRQSLLKLESKLDTTRMPLPSFKMVLTGVGRFAYQDNDGVFIVPIGCLKD